MSREQVGIPCLLVSLQSFFFLCVGREVVWHIIELKIHRFRCRKNKILYPLKIITFAQVTQRNFLWKSLRVVLKLIACFGLRIFLICIRDELFSLRGLGNKK